MLELGVIRPNTNLYANPIVWVKKNDGSWRLCVDYKCLNESTIKNKYPIPIVKELLDKLRGAKVFSKIDLWFEYSQIRMHIDSIEKITFKTHRGAFWIHCHVFQPNECSSYVLRFNELNLQGSSQEIFASFLW